jgi:hypothetical protein
MLNVFAPAAKNRNSAPLRWFRLTMLLGCILGTATSLGSATLPASAAAGGVHFDPESPAGKEYALPLDEARNEATGTGNESPEESAKSGSEAESGESAPLFGEGVSGGGASTGGEGQSGAHEKNGAKPSGSGAQGSGNGSGAGGPVPEGNGGYPVLAGIGLTALIVLIGLGAGLGLRSRRRVRPT